MSRTDFDRWAERARAEEAERRDRQDAHRAVAAKTNRAARGEDYENWHERQPGSRRVREPASVEHTTTSDFDGSDDFWGAMALLAVGAMVWLLWTFVGWVWSEFTATVTNPGSEKTYPQLSYRAPAPEQDGGRQTCEERLSGILTLHEMGHWTPEEFRSIRAAIWADCY